MDPISKGFVAGIGRYVAEHGVELAHFVKGERKDDIALGHLAGHDGTEGITFVGRAQEKSSVFRTERRVNATTGARYPFIVKASAVVNQFYFYGVDDDFGPFFFKFGTYFPYTARCCINVHHWAQRQAARAGIGFTALDNGFAAWNDPTALRRSVPASGPTMSARSSTSGWPVCPDRSPTTIGPPTTTTTSRSSKPSSPSPRSSTVPWPAPGCSPLG